MPGCTVSIAETVGREAEKGLKACKRLIFQMHITEDTQMVCKRRIGERRSP